MTLDRQAYYLAADERRLAKDYALDPAAIRTILDPILDELEETTRQQKPQPDKTEAWEEARTLLGSQDWAKGEAATMDVLELAYWLRRYRDGGRALWESARDAVAAAPGGPFARPRDVLAVAEWIAPPPIALRS